MDLENSTPQIKKHITANVHLSKKQIITANFLGGLAWGFGTVVGATVVVAIIVAILHLLGVFDAVNSFLQGSRIIIPSK